MQKDFGISSITMGYLFAAFAWSDMLAQLPGGWLLDRFGSKRVYAWAIFAWSLTTFLQGFVGYFGVASAVIALFVLRIAVGVAERPAFPGNSRLVAAWFPGNERGTAAAIFNSAQYPSAVAFTPLMGWLTHSFDWPSVFYVMAAIGMVFTGIWLATIYAPTRHPMVNSAEIAYLRRGGALVDLDSRAVGEVQSGADIRRMVKELLQSRTMIGL